MVIISSKDEDKIKKSSTKKHLEKNSNQVIRKEEDLGWMEF